ncbi:MAG: TonB-system energizer ExbB [Thermodesulfobacteria bacterium]|nr:TonB-system energizer ExbB [Thermodesulfobacteriota bacterium]
MYFLKLLVDYGIIVFLFLLSIIAFGIGIERYRFYKKIDISIYKSAKELEMELTKGLYIIATIASNAPYIGLLGTVLGIMFTFYMIGHQGLVETNQIMVGLALALKATAMGLLVAIPCTALYNFLLRRVREIVAKWEVENGRKGI